MLLPSTIQGEGMGPGPLGPAACAADASRDARRTAGSNRLRISCLLVAEHGELVPSGGRVYGRDGGLALDHLPGLTGQQGEGRAVALEGGGPGDRVHVEVLSLGYALIGSRDWVGHCPAVRPAQDGRHWDPSGDDLGGVTRDWGDRRCGHVSLLLPDRLPGVNVLRREVLHLVHEGGGLLPDGGTLR